MRRRLALSLLLLMGTLNPAFADCASEQGAARASVLALKQQALAGETLDVEQFSLGFQQRLSRLQLLNCGAELMQLAQFLQQERQTVPVSHPAPGR